MGSKNCEDLKTRWICWRWNMTRYQNWVLCEGNIYRKGLHFEGQNHLKTHKQKPWVSGWFSPKKKHSIDANTNLSRAERPISGQSLDWIKGTSTGNRGFSLEIYRDDKRKLPPTKSQPKMTQWTNQLFFFAGLGSAMIATGLFHTELIHLPTRSCTIMKTTRWGPPVVVSCLANQSN